MAHIHRKKAKRTGKDKKTCWIREERKLQGKEPVKKCETEEREGRETYTRDVQKKPQQV